MALDQNGTYPVGTTGPSAAYPEGEAVNSTAPGALDGFPWEKDGINDKLGFQQALLRSAGIAASGVPDTALVSQYLQAIIELAQGRALNYDESGIAGAYVLDVQANQQAPASLFDGQLFTFIVGNTNAGASTVNPVGLGVKNIVDTSAGGELTAGEHATVLYRLGSDDCMLVDHFDNATTVMAANTTQDAIDEGIGTNQNRVAAAWINMNGTGTIAIRDDFNVASLTDNGTGDYTVNFTTAIGNTDYCLTPSGNASEVTIQNQASASMQIRSSNSGGAAIDAGIICCPVFTTK